jgi:hypothetical protein
MRSYALFALGLAFILTGAGLIALTLRRPKPGPANPKKAQLREQAERVAETKKLRIAGGLLLALGLLLGVMGRF